MDRNSVINILFVDDDSNSCLMAKLYLERKDFKVYVVNDTIKARNLVGRIKFDIVISDIGMPGENGIDFFKWLKDEDDYKNIPIFLISAHASNLADLDPNADVEFFEKPLFFPGFIDRIQKILQSDN